MDDRISSLNSALAGRYVVERRLGEGGMATVYLATDQRHERKVALKVLKSDLAAAVGAQRFLLEITTTANLRHPHILPLFDSGEAGSFLFYVMPYVEGESLRERLNREPQLPVDEAVRLAVNVAEALDHAHRHGIIHRDIKPANILLQDGKAMVSDFGIALAVRGAVGNRMTETGFSLGTPHYMSPEQATGGVIGPATDIYALGCVLYEMLVGVPPYTGSTQQAILARITRARPDSVSAHRRSVPAHVDAAVEVALEKIPADRFATAQDFAKALTDPGFRHPASPAGRQALVRWRRMAVAGWLAGIAGLGIGAWAILQSEPASTSVSRNVLETEGWAGTGAPFGHLAAISPDGSKIVLPLVSDLSANVAGAYSLGLKLRGSTEIVPIPGTHSARDVVFAPDGDWIAYVLGGDIVKRRLSDGAAVTIGGGADNIAAAIAWLDDGTILFEQRVKAGITTPSRIVRIPEAGGSPVQIIEPVEGGPMHPIWLHGLPDSRGALVVSCAASATCRAEGASLHVLDLARGSYELVMERVMRAWYVRRTRHVIVARPDGGVFALQFDPSTMRPNGSPIPLLEGVRVGGNQVDMVMSDDGTVLYVDGHATAFGLLDLVWVDRSGNEQPLDPGLGARGFTTLALSPDDRFLAVSIETIQASDIWIKELPDGPLTRLSGHSAITRWPFWSRDGSMVSYHNNDGGTPHVRRVRSDGSSGDAYEVVLRREDPVMEAVYTPDGRGMIFREVPSVSRSRLGFLDLEAARVTREPHETGLNEKFLALSQDGRWIAFVSDVTGRDEVYVRRVLEGGARTQVSTNGGVEPVWAHNGRELFYREPASGSLMVATYTTANDFRVQTRQRLFDASAYSHRMSPRTWDVTRDDQRFVFMRPASEDARLVLIENWFAEIRN